MYVRKGGGERGTFSAKMVDNTKAKSKRLDLVAEPPCMKHCRVPLGPEPEVRSVNTLFLLTLF